MLFNSERQELTLLMAWNWLKKEGRIAGFLYFFALIAWGIYFISIVSGSLMLVFDIFTGEQDFLELPTRIYIHDSFEAFANGETANILSSSVLETSTSTEGIEFPNKWCYYLASLLTIGLNGIVLYGLTLLGHILRSLRRQDPWSDQNSKNLRMIGYLMLFTVFYKYGIGWLSYLMIKQIQLPTSISLIWPPVAWELGLAGLAVILAAYIFEEGTRLYEEQKLTV